MPFSLFVQNVLNGAGLGLLYSLVAIGYTIVYGILRLINFAHGDIFMMAMFFVYYGAFLTPIPWGICAVLAIGLTILLGATVERVGYRPLRGAPRVSGLCAAIGMSFFLENFAIVVFGGRPKPFLYPDALGKVVIIAGIHVKMIIFITPIVCVVALLGLNYLVHRTKMGLAMRAASRDFDTARVMGVDINKTVSFTFSLGSGLAAIGAILWAVRYPQIHPFIGVFPGWKAFTAAVIGGIGSINGAIVGGFLIGFFTIMLVAFFPSLSGYKDVFVFVILIVTLLLKPTGLFGELE